ncbi:Rap1a/Tai family immunity protein [Bradyrhizobium sp. STM 3562]|uniref:Rap1a/Tai family immunity protein n=1 Tax=Bradyrhizobium sp. STM 3562 TaxID=578924 RepID=UPI00388F9616
MLAFAVASIVPLVASRAESDRFNNPPASYSCFQFPDYCLKDYAKTHDRDVYDLCLLSERICRTHRYDWKLMSARRKEGPAVPSDCFPVVSVEDLLKLCKGEEDWEKDACRQNVATLTSQTNLRGKNWRSWTKSHLPVFCPKAESISDAEYLKAFVDWAEKHPSQKDLNADAAMIEATVAAWPCQSATVKRRRSQ